MWCFFESQLPTINHATPNQPMNKANNTSKQLLLSHPVCIAVAVIISITACSALILIAIGIAQSSSPQPPIPNHYIFTELQRLSAQLDRTEHHRSEKLDSVGERLDNLHTVLGVLAEAMSMAVETPNVSSDPIPHDLDENGVLQADSMDDAEPIG